VSTRSEALTALGPGVYGISNDRLDTPWPKVETARRMLRDALRDDPADPERLFARLDDTATAPDADLPETGVGLPLERALSSIRIAPTNVPHGGAYGTRVSTALVLDRDGRGRIAERTWDAAGSPAGEVSFDVQTSAAGGEGVRRRWQNGRSRSRSIPALPDRVWQLCWRYGAQGRTTSADGVAREGVREQALVAALPKPLGLA